MNYWKYFASKVSNLSKGKIKKGSKTLSQQSVILSVTDVTDNDDPIEKRLPEGYNRFHSDLT